MIKIKNTDVLESMLIYPAHTKLIDLLKWFCTRYSETVFTGMYEKRDYPSVHDTNPVRGMDIRSRVFEDPQAVADDVNNHWIYDPDRPDKMCALYHDVGRGPHFHLQVCDHTEIKK